MKNLKELGLLVLQGVNDNVDSDKVVTCLKIVNGNDSVTVSDYSYFADKDYMSKGLLDALKNGKTLTDDQEFELSNFKIEASLVLN